MKCLSPRTVGFKNDGKTIAWSKTSISKEYPLFKLPCSKCIKCRLEYARQWAIRSVHESKMHERNSFITLTYKDHPGKLKYEHIQRFIKRVRKQSATKISFIAAGEYGAQTKRPHWHLIIFGWIPSDPKYLYTNEHGDKVYTSDQLERLWEHGHSEIGSVTFKSAGYVARYAAKKLDHGKDGTHDYNPIFRVSSKNAIGKKFLEKYWQDIFNYGEVILSDGVKSTIPRYYEKWLKQNKPQEWVRYYEKVKFKKMSDAQDRQSQQWTDWLDANSKRHSGRGQLITLQEVEAAIIKERFDRLKKSVKL